MKKVFLLLATGMLMFSCSQDEATTPDVSTGDAMTVSFNVKTPATGVVSYADLLAVGDESKVNDLYVYVFGPKPAPFVAQGNTDDYVLEGIFHYDGAVLNTGGSQTLSGITVRGKNVKHFYFVANRQFGVTVGTTTETAVINAGPGTINNTDYPILSLDGSQNLTKGMPMSAAKAIDFTSGTGVVVAPATDMNVTLERNVARVDVNNANGDKFTIKSIQFKSRYTTHMFRTDYEADGVTSKNTALGYTLPAASVRAANGYAGDMFQYGIINLAWADQLNNKLMSAAGYLYESAAADNAVITVRGLGPNSTEYIIDVPFKASSVAIPVLRNHVYKLNIKFVEAAGLYADLTVVDWVDGGIIENPDLSAYVLNFVGISQDAANTGVLPGNPASGSLTIPADGGTYTVNVDTKGLELALLNAVNCPWISGVTIAYDSATTFYKLTFTAAAYTQAEATANLLANRAYSIYVKGNTASSPSRTLRVSQTVPVVPAP